MANHLHQFEQIIIGTVIFHGSKAYSVASTYVTSAHFADAEHRMIWLAFEHLSKSGKLSDAPSVYCGLAETMCDTLGSYPSVCVLQNMKTDIVQYMNLSQSTESAGRYAKAIRKEAISKSIVDGLSVAQKMASRPDVDMDEVNGLLTGIMRLPHITDEEETLASVWNTEPPSAEVGGLSWGINDMDEKLPLSKGRFTILAAQPGTGKTVFASQAACESAINGERVAFISLEMPAVDLKERIKLRHPKLEDWMRNITFVNSRGITTDTLGPTIERLAMQGHGIIIIDYIQRVTGKDGMDEVTKVALASRACADGALRNKVAVLGLAQFNRDGTKPKEKPRKPSMSDLKGSSCLEQDADYILFVWDQHNTKETTPDGEPRLLTLVVGKNRHGSFYKDGDITLDGRKMTIYGGKPRGNIGLRPPKPSSYATEPDDGENLFA